MDGQNANSVESTNSSAEFNVVTFPVENLGAAEDCKVFKFGLSDSGTVVSNDHELAVAISKLFESELVT